MRILTGEEYAQPVLVPQRSRSPLGVGIHRGWSGGVRQENPLGVVHGLKYKKRLLRRVDISKHIDTYSTFDVVA